MNDVINAIVNNGVAIGLLIYFVYKDNKFNDTINKSLTNISDTLSIIKDMLKGDKN